ncbi:hypothetical protein [Methyloceanibacter caenitepidi]|uniref:Uncharacterized protein n=1 Tax=Methyloceanibacter caenitepidi TaxID=1384459 RepID=A0A0A8K0X6_9HYPH|nr:hypothetical protein [Methyloceanibacter caenitepidi]BAQ15654.1 hypothetical protein GL4_0184 [Methyloceanibacter caenitepidi]
MNTETYLEEARVAHRKILEAAAFLHDAAEPFADTPRRRAIEGVAADAEKLARDLEAHLQEVLRGLWQGE